MESSEEKIDYRKVFKKGDIVVPNNNISAAFIWDGKRPFFDGTDYRKPNDREDIYFRKYVLNEVEPMSSLNSYKDKYDKVSGNEIEAREKEMSEIQQKMEVFKSIFGSRR